MNVAENRDKKKILIVDDEPMVLQVLTELCEEIDLTVDVASDGLGGLEKARSSNYDFFLCDIEMPGMNGIELLDQLFEENKLPSLTYVITGGILSEQSQRAHDTIKKTTNGVLKKPISLDVLEQKLCI